MDVAKGMKFQDLTGHTNNYLFFEVGPSSVSEHAYRTACAFFMSPAFDEVWKILDLPVASDQFVMHLREARKRIVSSAVTGG